MKRGWTSAAVLLVWLPVVVYAVVVSREFFLSADSAVTLTTDDGVGNISYALATEGRYGFLSSPLLADMPRHSGIFSYGPFYFYVGAGLIWMFGYSIVLLRAIHLAVIIGVAAAGGVWFRGVGAGGLGALVALGLLMAFERGQWPMVRPDSLVSLFTIALVIAAGHAISTKRSRYWFAAGVAASCAAFTHLAAWAIIPAAAAIALVGLLVDARDGEGRWRRPPIFWRPIGAIVGGGVVGASAFYASFGFRIGDQIAFLKDYQSYTGSLSESAGGSFRDLIGRHFELAYWYLPYPMAYLVAGTMVVATAAVVGLVLRTGAASRRSALAVLAPPTIVWIVYLVSLGFYNNFHQGYAILNQVMWVWTSAAIITAGCHALERSPSWRRTAGVVTWVTALALGLGLLTVLGQRTNYRALAVEAQTPIGEYVSHVLDALPARSRAWGTVELGVEHPQRIQLVQFWDGIKILDQIPSDRRPSLAPDYLVWGHVENGMNAATVINGSGTPMEAAMDVSALAAPWRFFNVFPTPRYTLVAMTAGPPYGVTRIYALRDGAPALDRPLVSIYDPTQRQWRRALGAPIAVATSNGLPGAIRGGDGTVKIAVQTLNGQLPSGLYLLRVRMAAGLPPTLSAVVMAGNASEMQVDAGRAGSAVDVAPWFVDEADVYLVYEHGGGAFQVSQFGTQLPALTGVEASPIWPLTSYRGLRRVAPPEHAIHASSWTNAFPEISVAIESGQAVASVAGSAVLYGYQAYGPRIAVTPGDRVRLRIPIAVTAGRGCLGVLDQSMLSWLLAPDRLLPEYEFLVGESRTILPVLADCSASLADVMPMRATIGDGTYAAWSDQEELYVDELMREFQNAKPR